jgi:hypothetical protein
MIGHLQSIIQSMDEYVKVFNNIQGSTGDQQMTLEASMWEAGEWTAVELEALVDWKIWGAQSLASLVNVLGMPTGIAAPANPSQLTPPTLKDLFGESLHTAIVSLWSLPTITGFQYDVITAHTIVYGVLYSGLPESLENLIVERYDAGAW